MRPQPEQRIQHPPDWPQEYKIRAGENLIFLHWTGDPVAKINEKSLQGWANFRLAVAVPWRSKKHRDTAAPPPRSACGLGNSNNSDNSSTVQQPLTITSLIYQKAWWDTPVMVTNLATRDTTLWLDFSAWGNDLKSHRMKELGASTPLVEPPFSAISTG